MVPFERALMSSYRPSIVTFPLSLCVSEILPLLFSRTPLFPTATSSLSKISPCSAGSRWIAFSPKSEDVGLIVCAISFQESNLCDHNPPTSQTNRRTTCDRKTALCTKVHCAVKNCWNCKLLQSATTFIVHLALGKLQSSGPRWLRTLFLFLFLGLLLSDFQCTKAFPFHNRSSLNFAYRMKTILSTIAPSCLIFKLSVN